MTTTDAGLMPLVLQLGRARAAAMDVAAVLTSVCSAMPSVLGVGGAVLLLVEPPDGVRALTASDTRARWFGEAQQHADLGPLPGAVRTWRPMLTGDLTRIGPPSVAAAATECGLVSSLVLPFDVDGDRLGVLQLLGEAKRPVEAAHADVLRPLLDALAARLADVRALHRARSRPGVERRSAPDAVVRPAGDAPGRPPAEVGPRPPSAGRPAPQSVPAVQPTPADGLPIADRATGVDRAVRPTRDRPAADDRPAIQPARPARRRRGAHSRGASGPGEETTRALPVVPPPRPSAAGWRAETGAAEVGGAGAEARRTPRQRSTGDGGRGGRHSA